MRGQGSRLLAASPGRGLWPKTLAPSKAPKVVGEAACLAQRPALSGPLSPPRGQVLAYAPQPPFLALRGTREGLGPFGTLPRGRELLGWLVWWHRLQERGWGWGWGAGNAHTAFAQPGELSPR